MLADARNETVASTEQIHEDAGLGQMVDVS